MQYHKAMSVVLCAASPNNVLQKTKTAVWSFSIFSRITAVALSRLIARHEGGFGS
jgi:hypothetical protein